MYLIERQDTLDLFEELVWATSGGRGSVLLIMGATGLGKSALLHAFQRRGRELGAAVLTATASEAEQDLPLGVLSQLLHASSLAAQDRATHTSLTLASAGNAAASQSMRPAAPPADLPALDAMCAPLMDLSTDRPLVISVDDVEHADEASRRALLFLARRVHHLPITLVLSQADPSGRAEYTPAEDLARQPHCHTVHLAPLSIHGVRKLASSLVGDAGSRLSASWYRLSGGNPLLVAALAGGYQDHLRTPGADDPAATPVAAARYGQAVLTCLHRGGEQLLRVARGLAVLGGDEWLDELLDLPADQVARGLRALAAAGLTSGGTFRDDAARSAVLSDMSAEERMALHRVAAELTHGRGRPTGTVAEHLVRADRITDPWGVDVLDDAAARALCEDRAERAIAYLRRARADCADERRRNEITIKLVRAEWRINPALPVDRLSELTEATRRGAMAGACGPALIRALLWHGRSEQAGDVLDTVLRSEPRQPCTANELIVLRDWMRCTYPPAGDPRLDELPGGRDNGPTTPVAVLRRLAAAKLLADVLSGSGPDGITARAEHILRGCRPDDASFDALVWTLHALTYGDCLEQAQAWCEAISGGVAAEHAPNWSARLAGIRSEIAVRTGDMRAAERSAREALELVPPAGWGVAIGEPLSTLVLAATALGRHETAAEQLALPVPDAMFETRFGLQYLRARGCHSLATGNPALALRDFRLCGELMDSWRLDAPAFLPWRTDAAEALLRMGRPEEARPLVEAQLARCGPATPRAEGRTIRLQAATSDPYQRPALLHRATDLLQAGGDRYEMSLALRDLAEAYRARGAYRRAATIARRAQVVAPDCDGVPLAPPVPPPAAVPETALPDMERYAGVLSDAERRVAVLAALGYSNREIAKRLWITVSTVEQHLTRAYRKLDVTRRSDLPAGLKALC